MTTASAAAQVLSTRSTVVVSSCRSVFRCRPTVVNFRTDDRAVRLRRRERMRRESLEVSQSAEERAESRAVGPTSRSAHPRIFRPTITLGDENTQVLVVQTTAVARNATRVRARLTWRDRVSVDPPRSEGFAGVSGAEHPLKRFTSRRDGSQPVADRRRPSCRRVGAGHLGAVHGHARGRRIPRRRPRRL